jgi:hypothetical protein
MLEKGVYCFLIPVSSMLTFIEGKGQTVSLVKLEGEETDPSFNNCSGRFSLALSALLDIINSIITLIVPPLL